MAETSQSLEGPDFEKGCDIDKVPDGGMLLGHAFGEAILAARRGEEIFAIGATCTHYGGPQAKGLVGGCTGSRSRAPPRLGLRSRAAIRCPALSHGSGWSNDELAYPSFITGSIG